MFLPKIIKDVADDAVVLIEVIIVVIPCWIRLSVQCATCEPPLTLMRMALATQVRLWKVLEDSHLVFRPVGGGSIDCVRCVITQTKVDTTPPL